MTRILIAWELGEGYGHLAEMLPLALALRAAGHEVRFALRDLARAEAWVGSRGFAYYQSPLWLGPHGAGAPEISLAEVLTRSAFGSRDILAGLVRAWRNLFADLAIERVVAVFAPTALIAARAAGLPAAAMGTGYALPPALSPLPTIRPWATAEPARLAVLEERLVGDVNTVLKAHGAAPIGSLAALYQGVAPILLGFPELDHYGARAGTDYFGSFADLSSGVAPRWPGGGVPRIFAYLSAGYPLLGKLLAALAASKAVVLLHARGAAADGITAPSAAVQIEPNPLAMAETLAACDLVVSHGGHGLTAQALQQGRPVVICPSQAEQALLAYRLHQQSLAVFAEAKQGGAHFQKAITAGLASPALRQKAAAFAARHRGHDPAAAAARAAELCSSPTPVR